MCSTAVLQPLPKSDRVVDVDVRPGSESALAAADVLGREGDGVDAGLRDAEDPGDDVHAALSRVNEAAVIGNLGSK